MTPIQIAYFKHFLFDRGIQALYISMYKKDRIKGGPEGDKNGNPESLEQFLQEQPPFRVFMHAFYFKPNSYFGYDYWKEINKKWLKYLDMQEDNPQNEKVVILKGSFAILRQNWDSSQYWKTETMEATYARMHMEPPLQGVDLETAFDIPHSNHPGDKLATEEPKDFSGITEADTQKSNAGSLLEGFSLVETSNSHGGKKMKSNTVSINLRNNGYRITFASKESEKLRKHGYKYVKLLTRKDTGEIALIFNNSSGCNVAIKKSGTSESHNVVINSKEVAEHIRKFYEIKSSIDYFTLKITATIQQDLNIIYKLKLSE